MCFCPGFCIQKYNYTKQCKNDEKYTWQCTKIYNTVSAYDLAVNEVVGSMKTTVPYQKSIYNCSRYMVPFLKNFTTRRQSKSSTSPGCYSNHSIYMTFQLLCMYYMKMCYHTLKKSSLNTNLNPFCYFIPPINVFDDRNNAFRQLKHRDDPL